MNLFVRLLLLLASFRRKRRLGVLDTSVIGLRVFPNDLDVYGHMNNGRYLTLMDLGRFDLIARSGMGRIAAERRWNPLVASVSIRYKKSLKLFQSFELQTRIAAWDAQWFILEQKFVFRDRVVAHAWVRGLFYGPDGKVHTAAVLSELGVTQPSPPVPEPLRTWPSSDNF